MAFGGPVTPKPLNRFCRKLGISDHIAHPTPQAKFGYNRFKGGVVAHARNSPLGVYFFPCAQLQTSPLDRPRPLMAQTKRLDAGHIPYMFSIKFLKFTSFYAPI